ncbi:Na(+)/H(+) antiporter subunit E1 [Clostridium tepidiprofundi DSM 19306]|uniref:Na(+)/H(+) antiporter subunit E1 n=1 Tax=Clostridium tepidiprofundi DSM 19306 TaxID=1121338 RepID=A0A151B6W9_9CLOT|nr:Na+/H+ antiporter subunit E [Clostridium tepidiprofundi]KYH35634.1 Na(+)/H(+) antiporter subunit E1 [Clostridium tepidiprofundi DSM 19306]
MKKVGAVISTTIFCFVFWLLYTLPFAGQYDFNKVMEEIIVGLIISFITAVFTAKFFIRENAFWLFNPVKLFSLIAFVPIYIIELFKANMDVAIRALSPKVKINPGIVKIQTDVESDYGLSMLANCITLTPGTITMDVTEENGQHYMYIHWIDVTSQDVKTASDSIKGAFEPWVRRVFK